MKTALHSFKIDSDGAVRVQHVFYGETEEDARSLLEEHAEACPKFGPAVAAGDTIEVTEELDALPTPDTVDDFVPGEPDDEDEEEEDEE